MVIMLCSLRDLRNLIHVRNDDSVHYNRKVLSIVRFVPEI